MPEKDTSLEIDKGNSVGIFVHIGVEGCISEVRGNVEEIFGYTPSEVKGHHISILMDDRVGRTDILNVEELQQKNLLGFRKDGEEFPLELTIDKIVEAEKSTCSKGYIGYIRDLTNEHVDIGTGLINQKQFKKQILVNLESVEKGVMYSLVVISFDNIYKYIDLPENRNIILKKYLDSIKKCVESFDIIDKKSVIYGSLQGDVVGIALFGIDLKKGSTISDKIRKVLTSLNVGTEFEPIHVLSGIGLVEGGNIKISKAIDEGLDISLSALHKGGNRVEVHNSESDKYYQLDRNWRIIIEKALIGQDFRFELYRQNIRSSKGSDEVYYETLLRLFDKNNKQISPNIFMPKSEQLNLSTRIDRYVIEDKIRWLSENPIFLSTVSKAAINLTGPSLSDKHMFEYIEKIFSIYKISPRKICFEVTETGEVKDKITAKSLIKKLQGIGCEVAIDDFGRGNSSAEKLYPGDYDKVKIDGKFIKGLIDENGKINELYKLFVKNVCEVSRLLGLKVVAEYVNGEITEKVLRELGVDYFQGYESSGEPEPVTNYNDKK